MPLLLIVPVLLFSARIHRYLSLYAPSNLLLARARTSTRRWLAASTLVALTAVSLASMHLVTSAAESGAPGWLYLVALVLAWDSIKLGLMGGALLVTSLLSGVARARLP